MISGVRSAIRHDLALQVAEAGQLDLAGPVVDDRLLGELDGLQARRGVRQARRVVVVGADREDEPDARDDERPDEQGDDDGADDRDDRRSAASARLAAERASMALAPREAGLHLWPHDSIGGVTDWMAASRRVETTRPVPL